MGMQVYVNVGDSDIPREATGSDYLLLEAGDYLIFSKGSTAVVDGATPIPSAHLIVQAGTPISTVQVEVAKCFVADVSENIIREVHGFGSGDSRYVFCFAFDAATASEPILELWDDSGMDSFDIYSLGAGDETASWWSGIVTTDSTPGALWVGSKLAGAADGHTLGLNGGLALDDAKDLYFNLKLIIPAGFAYAASETPNIVCKYN